MERRQEIQRTVFTAVAVDIAVILIFVVAWLNKPHDLVVFATIYSRPSSSSIFCFCVAN